jgi:hypothetical protein
MNRAGYSEAAPNKGMQRTRIQRVFYQLGFVRAADAGRWASFGKSGGTK